MHRVDDAQPAIVAALRAVGASVQSLAMVGGGCPDLLVGFAGLGRRTHLVEVKSEDERKRGPPRRRALRNSQVDWSEEWQGAPVLVVSTPQEVLRGIGLRPGDPLWETGMAAAANPRRKRPKLKLPATPATYRNSPEHEIYRAENLKPLWPGKNLSGQKVRAEDFNAGVPRPRR